MVVLQERTPLFVPSLHRFERDGIHYLVDSEAPNWIAVEPRGAALVDWIAGSPPAGPPQSFGDLVARYAAQAQAESGKAWLHAHDFLRSLDRAGMLSDVPF